MGWTRSDLSLYSIDYQTGEYIVPSNVPSPDNYWIEAALKDGNLVWVIFGIGIIYRFLSNLKIGKSCVLHKKMSFDKTIVNKERTWDEVFFFIFGEHRDELSGLGYLYCFLPFDTKENAIAHKRSIEDISKAYLNNQNKIECKKQ